MRISTSLLAASLAGGIFTPLLSAAQHQSATGQSQMSAESSRCAQAQLVITGTVDAAMARLETARQANSPAQMRATIDDVQGALRDVRAQLAPCATMQPAAGAHTGHAVPNMRQAPAATPPAGTDPHADHTMSQPSAATAPPASAPATKPATVMDPVTGLKVDPSAAPKTTYQGQTYYFSSEKSRKEFLQNPEKFVKKPKP